MNLPWIKSAYPLKPKEPARWRWFDMNEHNRREEERREEINRQHRRRWEEMVREIRDRPPTPRYIWRQVPLPPLMARN